MWAPSASERSVARNTVRQSAGRITVSTMLQNTAPAGTACNPATSVWSEDGVRHSTTLRVGPKRRAYSARRTAGKSDRSAHVRLRHPSAANVSSSPTIWGLPPTWTSGLGTAMPPAASRDPSPPARISPCTLPERPFDGRKLVDARGGDEPRRRRPPGRRQPARRDAQRGGGPDVRLEVVPHHPGPVRRCPQRGQRVLEQAWVGFRPAQPSRIADRRKQSRQAELLQTRHQIAREGRDDAEPGAP